MPYYQVSNQGIIKGIFEDSSLYISTCISSGNINCDLNTPLNNTDTIEQSQANLNIGDVFRQATDIEIQLFNLEAAFIAAWDTYDLGARILYDPLKQKILEYIQINDLVSLRALAVSQYIPTELQIYQQQLAALLPVE